MFCLFKEKYEAGSYLDRTTIMAIVVQMAVATVVTTH